MQMEDLAQATIHEREAEVARLRLQQDARQSAVPGQVQFLTNAARVLSAVLHDPGATMRDIANRVGQTERAVWDQLRQLEDAGLVTRQRMGRRNRYEVDHDAVQEHLAAEGASLLRM